ncbi:MAG: DUF6291 domain-containing protein [Clostridiales bacterium]|nr:DUF6291 domain-containing protein [Clostridiales bacterium]
MKEEQFTFYKVYWDAIKDEDNETVDAIVTGICEYMLHGTKPSIELDLIAVWDDLYEVLKEEHARQLKNPSGKTHRRNMVYFTFKKGYYNKMQCLSQEDSGAYIRAICEYMFYSKEPHDLTPQADRFYRVTKLPLELSRKRKKAGAKGGKANGKKKPKPATKTKATTEQKTDTESKQDGDTTSNTETVQEITTENEQTPTTTIDGDGQPTTAVTEQDTTVETEQITVFTQGQEDNSDTAQEVAAVDSDKEYTLESIEEFNCYGNINPNDSILKGIDYRELYYFVKDTKEAHNLSKYKAVKMYRNQCQR